MAHTPDHDLCASVACDTISVVSPLQWHRPQEVPSVFKQQEER